MKRFLPLFLCAALLLALAGCGGSGEAVHVQAVSMIASTGSAGFVERCAGKVVSGQTAKINRDADKKVLEVAVREGDMVKEGDLLFSYDAAAMELSLEKLRLELKTLENTIVSATAEIEELERQKSMVYVANQLSYTIQIDSKQADIREAEYNKAIKEREIAAMETALEATDVTAPIGGRIMSVNEESGGEGGNYGYDGGESGNAFITIMDISSYRVQGNINELNLYALTEGMEVLVRSRMDESVVWHGVISGIDWENPVSGNEGNMNYYVGASDEMTSSSKYPFYVELDNIDGLTLGQHVIIEPDYGQNRLAEGLWLPACYIVDAEGSPYVWAASSRDKLEKRSVTLGEYSEEMELYQVTGGLEPTDYIAFPETGLSAGRPVSYFDETNFGTDGNAGEGDVYLDGDGFTGMDMTATDGDAMEEPVPGEEGESAAGEESAPEEAVPEEAAPEEESIPEEVSVPEEAPPLSGTPQRPVTIPAPTPAPAPAPTPAPEETEPETPPIVAEDASGGAAAAEEG